MNRRSLFALLAALPLVGKLFRRPTALEDAIASGRYARIVRADTGEVVWESA